MFAAVTETDKVKKKRRVCDFSAEVLWRLSFLHRAIDCLQKEKERVTDDSYKQNEAAMDNLYRQNEHAMVYRYREDELAIDSLSRVDEKKADLRHSWFLDSRLEEYQAYLNEMLIKVDFYLTHIIAGMSLGENLYEEGDAYSAQTPMTP